MTSPPPQPWDTLPDDPADIPFPIVVGWEVGSYIAVPLGAEALFLVANKYGDPDWWMSWPTFPPDPMTVDAWHPMELLPDRHPEPVWIKYRDGGCLKMTGTYRKHDAELGRKRWRSVAAQMATTDANTAAAEAARGEG